MRRLVVIGQNINREGLRPETVELLKQDTMPDILPPMLQELYAAVSPDGPEHWDIVVDKVWQMIRSEPNISFSELGKVAAPTLVMVGEHDIPTVEHAEAMQRALPEARLEVVPDATHALPMEKPEVVGSFVLDFLGATPVSRTER